MLKTEKIKSTSRPLVFMEFNTFQNDFDLQDLNEHVGIKVKSMISNKTTSWSCDITSQNIYSATISYNSISNLTMVLTRYQDTIPIWQFTFCEIDWVVYLQKWVSFGFSVANGRV